MGNAYSRDLRERALGFVERGGSRHAAARHFGVSVSTAVWVAASQAEPGTLEAGTLEPRKQGRPPGKGKLLRGLPRRESRGGARHHAGGARPGAPGRARGEGAFLVDLAGAQQSRHDIQNAPTLRKGDVVIADNLAVHKSPKAAAILRERGAWFLFLPSYSPDLNPIEMALAKLKAHLRRIGARTLDALRRAVGEICGVFDLDECWNYFREAGYVSD
jgi:transposase